MALVAPSTGLAITMLVLVTLEQDHGRIVDEMIASLQREPEVMDLWYVTREQGLRAASGRQDMQSYEQFTVGCSMPGSGTQFQDSGGHGTAQALRRPAARVKRGLQPKPCRHCGSAVRGNEQGQVRACPFCVSQVLRAPAPLPSWGARPGRTATATTPAGMSRQRTPPR